MKQFMTIYTRHETPISLFDSPTTIGMMIPTPRTGSPVFMKPVLSVVPAHSILLLTDSTPCAKRSS